MPALQKTSAAKRLRSETGRNISAFLQQHPVGALATVDPNGNPHVTAIYYALRPDFSITFTTKRQTRKFDNLAHRNHAMLVVFDAATQTSVQITGTAEEITDQDEAYQAFRDMLTASMATSRSGLPPISKIHAGRYVAVRLRPVQIRMASYERADPGSLDMYESVEFEARH